MIKWVIGSFCLLLILFPVITGFCASLFPTEVLYRPRPWISFHGGLGGFDLEIAFRRTFQTWMSVRIDQPVLGGLIQTESSYIIHSVSTSYAIGLFQTKPFTAEGMGIWNPFNPYQGEKVLSYLLTLQDRLGSQDLALAAYHMGSGVVRRLQQSGQDPLINTPAQRYVHQIREFSRQYPSGSQIPLRDYLWFHVQAHVEEGEGDYFKFASVIPTLWFGSTALGIEVDHAFHGFVYQQVFVHPRLQIIGGFDRQWLAGIQLKPGTWKQSLSILFYPESLELGWQFSSYDDPWDFRIRAKERDWELRIGFHFFQGFFGYAGVKFEEGWLPFIGVLLRF